MNWKSIILIFILTLSVVACDDDTCFKSKGDVMTEYRELPEQLSELIVYDNLHTHIYIDTINYLKIIAGANMLPHIKSEIDNQSLILSNGNSCGFLRDFDQDLKVELHIKSDLNKVKYEALGDFIMHDTLKKSTFYFDSHEGGGKVVLYLNTEFSQVFIVGGFTETHLFGRTLTARLLNAGSSWMYAQNFPAIYGDLENRSAGDMYVNISDSIHSHIGGAGDIRYYGHPKVTVVAQKGRGQIYPMGP